MASLHQPAILRPVPSSARFVEFSFAAGADARGVLSRLAREAHDPRTVVGLGEPLVTAAGSVIEGLRAFPSESRLFPSTQRALWLAATHGDRGAAFDAVRAFAAAHDGSLVAVDETDAFAYRGGRDLSGFEDGTENPKGKAALAAAIVRGRGKGLDGASFVATQRWVHDLAALEAMPAAARDAVIGRRLRGNAEIAGAPASSHVKRTAQEAFDPAAFVVRRSMPWGGAREHGLYFVAYGESLDRFERLMHRMAGRDDGVVDALFSFTRPVSGAHYFCPPLRQGRLDLRALGF